MDTFPKRPIPTYDLYGEKRLDRSRFWMHAETIAARSRLHRWEIKTHRHETFFQILYIRSGIGEALFGGAVHPLSAGSIVTVPPSQAHGFRFARDMDGLVVTFVAARLGALADMLSIAAGANAAPLVVTLDPAMDDSRYLTETLDRLGGALAAGGSANSALAEAYLSTSLHLIDQVASNGTTGGKKPGTGRLERLMALVATHAREHRPVTFYADRMGMSQTHLNRIVTAASGRSMSALLADKLIEEAQRLLVFTGLGVRDVAANLGFADPAYFSRYFLAHSGMTPRGYRLAERAKMHDEKPSLPLPGN